MNNNHFINYTFYIYFYLHYKLLILFLSKWKINKIIFKMKIRILKVNLVNSLLLNLLKMPIKVKIIDIICGITLIHDTHFL